MKTRVAGNYCEIFRSGPEFSYYDKFVIFIPYIWLSKHALSQKYHDIVITAILSRNYHDILVVQTGPIDFPECSVFRSVDNALKWVKGARCHSRAPYHADSRRSYFRKHAVKRRRLELAAQNLKITFMFEIQNSRVNKLPEP